MMKATIVLALAALLPLAGAAPQEPTERNALERKRLQDPARVHRLDELVMSQYRPEHRSAVELAQLLHELLGRRVLVEERGGAEDEGALNVSVLGANLVLYDTAPYVARMADLLAKLDAPQGGGKPSEELVAFEYRPRYLSMGTMKNVLRPFDQGGRKRGADMSLDAERGLVVVRDTPERVADMRALLERVDVPSEQLVVSCHLLSTGAGAGGARVPAELLEHLTRLVPGQELGSMGFALVRTSVTPGARVSLKVEGREGASYRIAFEVAAYDPETGSLTVEDCGLERAQLETVQVVGSERVGAVSGVERVFSTNTILRGDDYTVLGAAGAEPVFVVLHVQRAGR